MLSSEVFAGLKMAKICVCGRGSTPDPISLAGLRGLRLMDVIGEKGKEKEGKGEEKGSGRKGKGK